MKKISKKVIERAKALCSNWIISISIVALICLLIVQILYKTPAIIPFFESTWTAGDLLSFLGAIIGAAATIYVLQETIKVTIAQQKEEHAYLIRPYIMASVGRLTDLTPEEGSTIVDVSGQWEGDKWTGSHDIYIKINNVGAGNAVDVKGEFYQDNTPDSIRKITLPPLMLGENYYFSLKNCHVKKTYLVIRYSDIASIKHYKVIIPLQFMLVQSSWIHVSIEQASVTMCDD